MAHLESVRHLLFKNSPIRNSHPYTPRYRQDCGGKIDNLEITSSMG